MSHLRHPLGPLLFLFGLALAPPARLVAQQPGAPAGMDIIRGRVVGPDSQPVAGAHVVVRVARGKETRDAVTNAHGAYTVLFPGITGDYVVSARFIGLAPATVRVVRVGTNRVLTGDLTLAPARGAQHELERVTVTARRRPRPERGRAASVDDAAGIAWDDLHQPRDAAGAPLDHRQYSVLGTDASENSLSVNGAEVRTVLPDAVGMGGRVKTTSADASAGGFSGGQVAVGMGGAESYHLRYFAANVAPAALKWVDRPSAEAGAQSSTLNASLWTSDPLFDQRAHTTSVLTVSQHTTPLPDFPTSSAGLARLGLAPDSLARFLALTNQAGIPATVEAVPSRQRTTRVAWMGRLDLGARDATTRFSLDANLGAAGREGAFLSPSTLPSYGGRTRETGGFVTAAFSRFVGNNVLTDVSTTANAYDTRDVPYLARPAGRVRVLSELPTGDSALTWLEFGGNPAGDRTRTASWQTRGSAMWLSPDTTRQYRVGGELFTEQQWAEPAANARGTFEFESLEALSEGRATRFTRQIESADRHGSGVRGALWSDNLWRLQPRLALQFGLRLDMARIAAPMRYNAAIDSLFGAHTDALPRLTALSPRLGLRWRYGARDALPSAISFNGGRYQSYLGAGTAVAASQATGLPSAARLLDCVGDAAPAADWTRYGADPTSIPESCTDGSAGVPVTPAVPSVRLFEHYHPPAQWRTALTWDNFRWTWFRVSLVHSRGTARQSAIDRNLQATPQFTLADEGERPVYVPATAIVPATGAASLAASRRSTRFGPVLASLSDLHTTTTELVLSKVLLRGHPIGLNMQYRNQVGREQARGFDGITAGDPFAAAWGRAALPRHALFVHGTLSIHKQLKLTALAMLRSGMPYTPRVAGDVNGDGLSNDLVFVPPLASPLGESMAAALRGTPASARRCLDRQAGRTVARNSCTGPWSGGLDLQLQLSPSWLPREAGIQVDLTNAAGAADRLLHGSGGMRGWGDAPAIDPTLLVVQGFDPTARRFRYQVNPRFGQRAGASAWHRPVELRISVRTPIGPSLTTQQNRTRARAVRTSRDDPSSVGRVIPAYNVFAAILRLETSLQLGPDQADSLRAMEGRWRQTVDSVQTALTDYVEQLSDSVPDREIVTRVNEASTRVRASMDTWLPVIRELLTVEQFDRLPRPLQGLISGRNAGSIGSAVSSGEF